MKELVEKVAELYAAFEKDAKAQLENGNKAAGTRARKASLEIEKTMKEFRKASLEDSKSKRKRRFNAVKVCRSAVFFILCIMAVLYK